MNRHRQKRESAPELLGFFRDMQKLMGHAKYDTTTDFYIQDDVDILVLYGSDTSISTTWRQRKQFSWPACVRNGHGDFTGIMMSSW